jgi:hypothetical protein
MITGLERSEGDIRINAREVPERFAVLSICSPDRAPGVTDEVRPIVPVANIPPLASWEHVSNYQLLIYRLDGALSITFVTDCASDDEACQKAGAIERLGYRVEVWRVGTRIQRQERH